MSNKNLGFPEELIYACGFCLGETPSKTGPPDGCPKCDMWACNNCNSWLKGPNPSFCYGCGAVFPKVRSRMVGTYQTAYIYLQQAFIQRNCEREPRPHVPTYSFGTSIETGAPKRLVWKDAMVGGKLVHEDERELTDDEWQRLSARPSN